MKPTAAALAAVAFVALLAAPLASATYDAGSTIEADTPAVLSGRTDALVSHGVASFVSGDPGASLVVSLVAGEVGLRFVEVPPSSCGPTSSSPIPTTPPSSCDPAAMAPRVETATLTDARVALVRALTAYKLVVTNDESYGRTSSFGAAGNLVATSGASTVIGANPEAIHISPFNKDWTDAQSRERDEPIYNVDALEANAASLGGTLRGDGGLQILLQGVEVRVTGTDEDGAAYDRTFRTPWPSDGDDTTFLVLETTDADLRAVGAAPLAAFVVKTVDARGAATFAGATGEIVKDGASTTYDGDEVTLAGPISLTVTGTREAQPPRVTYAVSSNLRVATLFEDEKPETDPVQLAAASAAGAGGAALLAALVYFWPRLKFATTLLLLPLYTRIERTAVLEHEKRDEIYELIRSSPGIHAHEIGEKTRIGWGTTVYHLKMLEQHSLIVSKKSGRYKRFFVNTGEYTKKKDVYGALRNETAKAVANYVANHPGCNQKELCEAVGIQPSLASWHVDKLEGVELVKRVKDGRQVRYFAGPAWEMLNVPTPPTGDDGSTAAS